MISIILYGRNDSHGYNLHKRAALSINCIAEVLTHPNDEIIFVDCNTPDDMPTFLEAIRDTLTPRARQLTRVIRLRPALFEKHKRGTHLKVLEPLSRNIAIRRNNPKNRWILSTNTDMVFVSRVPGKSLSDIVADTPDGFYELPRFEVPETLWETLDRTAPTAIIDSFSRWGQRLHINEVIISYPAIRYDGPGDFQLMLREQIYAIHGFDEAMVLGWHVDSNLCKRMYLLNGVTDTLVDKLFAYHCDHTRQSTIAHGADRVENSLLRFFERVDSPYLPEQAITWGLPHEKIEEIRLTDDHAQKFAQTLETMLPGMQVPLIEDEFSHRTFNHGLNYDNQHVLPYISDHITLLPPDADVGYWGGNVELLRMLGEFRRYFNHTGCILVDKTILEFANPTGYLPLPPECQYAEREEALKRAFLYVFDAAMMSFPRGSNWAGFSIPEPSDTSVSFGQKLFVAFITAAKYEVERIENAESIPHKFVLVGSQNTWFEQATKDIIGTVATPYNSYVRHGYVNPNAFVKIVSVPAIHTLKIGNSPEDKIAYLTQQLNRQITPLELHGAHLRVGVFMDVYHRYQRDAFLKIIPAIGLKNVDLALKDVDLALIELLAWINETDGIPEAANIYREVGVMLTKLYQEDIQSQPRSGVQTNGLGNIPESHTLPPPEKAAGYYRPLPPIPMGEGKTVKSAATAPSVSLPGEERFAAETLRMLLDAEDLPTTIKQYEHRLTPALLSLVQREIKTVQEEGESELAEGLENLTNYIEDVLTMRNKPKDEQRKRLYQPSLFQDFTYSKNTHWEAFDKFPPYQSVDPITCDLKAYQDLLIYNFIINNLPNGSRLLEIGGGDSRVINILKSEYECWNIDKFEGLGSGPTRIPNSISYHIILDYIGNLNRDLPDGFFDCVFSISVLEHIPENQEVFVNILNDIQRVLKPGGYSIHCFDATVKADGQGWSNSFLQYLFSNTPSLNQFVSFDEISKDKFLYTMSEAAYNAVWFNITQKPYHTFGKPFSYNILWQKAPIEAEQKSISPHVKMTSYSHISLPKISIITPSYNQARFLEECIDSVLSQGYPNLEYIIMDGGSKDGSVEIIRKYEKHLSYWQSKPDGGQYAAVDAGFRKTDGEIMAWINSDDKYHPEAFIKAAFAFIEHPQAEWITGRPTVWDIHGRLVSVVQNIPDWCRDMLLNIQKHEFVWIQQESTFWRRGLWNKAGACLNTSLDLAGDFELWLRFSRYAPLYFVDTYLSGFRSYGDEQRSHRKYDEYVQEVFRIIQKEKSAKKKMNGNSPMRYIPFYELQYTAFKNAVVQDLPQFSSAQQGSQSVSSYLLTVIVSSYKSEEFMRECLTDLVNQTVAAQTEIIIVDAHSPENERSIIEEFQRSHKQITYIHTGERIGVYAAWNLAIKLASGKYITPFSANDRLRKDAHEILVKALDENPAVMLVYGDTYTTATPHETFENHTRLNVMVWPPYSYEDLLVNCRVGPHPMWRRSLHDELGYFDESFYALGDQEFWLRIGERYPMLHIPVFTGLYWTTSDALSHRQEYVIPEDKKARLPYQARYRRGYLESTLRAVSGQTKPQLIKPSIQVSIIVPLYNALAYTKQMLSSLRPTLVNLPHEIIFVDNASTDGTPQFLDTLEPGIKVIKNDINRNFAGACNQGAEAASGKYLIFLNSDTILPPGWLEPMVNLVEQNPTIGIVGNKHIFPGTRKIHHAGTCFDHNLINSHYLVGVDMDDPRVNFQRDFQAVNFACCLVRKDLFTKIGGFNQIYINSCEDVELCLQARSLGYRVVYNPQSVIYHYGQRSPGRSKFEDKNMKILLDRWRDKIQPDIDQLAEEDAKVVAAITTKSAAQKRKRVAFLTTYNQACGIATHSSFVVSGLEKALKNHPEYDPLVVVLAEDVPAKERIAPDGLQVFRCWRRSNENFQKAFEILQREKITTLHIQYQSGLFAQTNLLDLVKTCTENNLQVLITFHSTESYLGKCAALVNQSTASFVHFEQGRVRFVLAGADAARIKVMPLGVLESIEPHKSLGEAKRLAGFPEDLKIISSFGFLQPHKGVIEILNALPEVFSRHNAIFLYVGGVHPDHQEEHQHAALCRQEAQRLGITERVRFIEGYLPEELVSQYLMASDVIVMNYTMNRFEASLAAAVALAHDRPLITSVMPPFTPLSTCTFQVSQIIGLGTAINIVLENPGFAEYLVRQSRIYRNENSYVRLGEMMVAEFDSDGKVSPAAVVTTPSVQSWPEVKVPMAVSRPAYGPHFGFNVIGYVSGNLGIGVTARNVIEILLERGIPVAITDLDPGMGRGRHDLSFEKYYARSENPLPYPINLYILPPSDLTALVAANQQLVNLPGHLNVAFSMWELPVIPPVWKQTLESMDAVVAESVFIRDTFNTNLSNVQAITAVHPLYLPENIQPNRKRFGLPEDGVLFITSFEPYSDPQRKNPQAVIDAFEQGVGHDKRAHLVIKLNNVKVDQQFHPLVAQLQSRIQKHPRIHILTESMDYKDVLSLYASCDVFVSLHRAEGLGLGLMECMALGKPVIATAWSGNMTFMGNTNACLVEYDLIPVEGSIPAYNQDKLGEKAVWANAHIDKAASWMRRLLDDPKLRTRIGKKAKEDMERYQQEARRGHFIDEIIAIWEHKFPLEDAGKKEAAQIEQGYVAIQTATIKDSQIDIVVPIYGQSALVQRCVDSVLATTTNAHVILVDDCSPGFEINQLFDRWLKHPRITMVKSNANEGFIGSCTLGASLSDAPFILFLNSDTEAGTPGWLEKLLPGEDDIAIVGAKLLHPPSTPGPMAGKIQHAGVARDDNGVPYHPFLGWDADSPQVNQPREVNAITGACFLVRRQVWDELGGWDARFGRGVYEDIDLCWQARQKGYRVLYQPAACLHHHSGASEAVGGRHLLYGQNRTDNLEKLLAKWQGVKSDEDIFFGKETVQRWRRARTQVNQAAGLLDKRQFNQALNLIQKVVKTAPDLPEVLIGYAQLLAAQGKHRQAAEQIVKALEIAPAHWDARLRLVDEWIAANEPDRAAKELLYLRDVFPNELSIQQRTVKLAGYLEKAPQVKPEPTAAPTPRPTPISALKAAQTLNMLLNADDLPAALKENEALLGEELLALVRGNAVSARTDGNSDLADGLDDLATYVAEVIAARQPSPEPTSQSTKTSPAAPEQLPVAPRPSETLRMLLEADDLAAALKEHKNKLDTSLLDLVRRNAETAGADGNTDLAQGLDNLAEIIAEVIEQRKETLPKQVYPQADDDQTLGVVLKRAQKQKSTKRRTRTKKTSRKT